MIEDPNPYSRNLFIVSTGFILFAFLGLEKLGYSELNFLMNSFLMQYPDRVLCVAWIALAWFWLSFYVHSSGEFTRKYREFMWSHLNSWKKKELTQHQCELLLKWCIKESPSFDRQYKKLHSKASQYRREIVKVSSIDKVDRKDRKFHFNLHVRLTDDDPSATKDNLENKVTVDPMKLWKLKKSAWVHFLFKDSAIITLVFPHLWAVMAAFSGFYVILT